MICHLFIQKTYLAFKHHITIYINNNTIGKKDFPRKILLPDRNCQLSILNRAECSVLIQASVARKCLYSEITFFEKQAYKNRYFSILELILHQIKFTSIVIQSGTKGIFQEKPFFTTEIVNCQLSIVN